MRRKVPAFLNHFLVADNINEIYNNARKSLSVQEILELDIKPKGTIQQNFTNFFSDQREDIRDPLTETRISKSPYPVY